MDLPWGGLRSLREIARHGTIAAAAEAQGYTAGAVSQQLAVLERAAGRPLLERVGRRVQLTDAGRVLVEHAGHILRAEEEARAALEAAGEEVAGALTVATFATFAASLLAPSIHTATARHPRLSVRTLEVHPDNAAAAVEHGDADVAFGLDYPSAPVPQAPTIDRVRIATERFGVGAASDRALGGREGVRLADLAGEPWILPPEHTNYGRAMFAACRRAGFEPDVAHVVDDTAVSLALAAQGLGLTMTTPMMLTLLPAPGLVRHELADDVRRDLVAIGRRGGQQRPTVAAITSIMRELAAPFDVSARSGSSGAPARGRRASGS
ncbi:LysR family transcriptional regulator [Solirubrobacter phytolaccae]|uniref:LysR family transcriptional regulator n=1 Tax=Solirubrobacter phytolaccae TaxID=1404360 RepID=A0A9X3S8U2_9ACTN|nr:LysR family transcriptional regulator [Solirubrobacter phytolaccae]MDA0181923.1 LysR family transcriptional regulator [Solirubrobacter phytolaccae]